MMTNFELGKSAVAVKPKVEPKKATGAYFYFSQQFIKSARDKDTALTQTEGAKLAGSKWGSMNEKEKTPFEKLATEDKVRVEKQMKQLATKGYFMMEDGTKSTDPANAHLAKKPKSATDDDEPEPLQPKRAMSGFIYFSMEFGAETRAKNPTNVVMSIGEISKLTSEKWGAMTEAQKQPYESKNAADKKRHEKQQQELNKMGYFMLEDGSKSTDVQNVPKKRKSMKPASVLSKSMSCDDLKTQKPRLSVKEVKEKVAKSIAKK